MFTCLSAAAGSPYSTNHNEFQPWNDHNNVIPEKQRYSVHVSLQSSVRAATIPPRTGALSDRPASSSRQLHQEEQSCVFSSGQTLLWASRAEPHAERRDRV